jgi:hypothetical protein
MASDPEDLDLGEESDGHTALRDTEAHEQAESLPWTSGEAPSLALLFRYLKVRFYLPSDTTVRNQLAKIFAELHGKVVREFTVRSLRC